MTEPTRAALAECLHCGGSFVPRKAGHVYCSISCRHRGERRPEERIPVNQAAVERLFDPRRDPDERVRLDDWHPGPPEMLELDACATVARRRAWYLNLAKLGRL
jgi:hypothetical protein